jgi:hypothetical protein
LSHSIKTTVMSLEQSVAISYTLVLNLMNNVSLNVSP